MRRCVIRDGVVVVGLGYVRTVSEADAQTVVDERERGGRFADVRDLAQRAPLQGDRLSAIVAAGACDSFGRPRRELLWELGLVPRSASVAGSGGEERQLALPLEPTAATPELPEQTVWERMLAEYGGTTLSIGVHPLELLRPHLPDGTVGSRDLPTLRNRSRVAVAGMVVARQRPSTANGVVFMLLEDEHGHINLIVPPPVYERHRATVRGEPLILARGTFEHVGRNRNIVVWQLETLGPLARQISGAASVAAALPDAHHFGSR